MKFPKKISLLTVSLIIILLITNPSYKKFQAFSKEFKVRDVFTNSKQTFNGFLFSLYTKEVAQQGGDHAHIYTLKYLGILSNFFELSRNEKDIKNYNIIPK